MASSKRRNVVTSQTQVVSMTTRLIYTLKRLNLSTYYNRVGLSGMNKCWLYGAS